MSGVRTGTRLEELERLRRRITHELDQARAHANPLTDLLNLAARVDDEIRAEGGTPPTPPRWVIHQRRRRRSNGPNVVDQLLHEHELTARHVKEWALRYGLISEIKRGRVGVELVRAYITAQENR